MAVTPQPEWLTLSTVLCKKCGFSIDGRTMSPQVTIGYQRANRIPSSSEHLEILSVIAEAEMQVQSYDDEIRQLHATAQRLERERSLVLQHIDHQRSLISSIRTLPNEVLGYIFLLCCFSSRENSDSVRSICKPSGYAPLNLGLVCRLWRDITISRPELWSNITIDLADVRDPGGSRRLLDCYLLRSKEVPLSVALYAKKSRKQQAEQDRRNDVWSDDREDYCTDLLNTIKAHTGRLCHLQLLGCSAQYVLGNVGNALARWPLGRLESCDLNLCDRCPLSRSQKAPTLRTVRLDATREDRSWHQSDLYDILKRWPQLNAVVLTFSSYMEPIEEDVPDIVPCTSSVSSFELNVLDYAIHLDFLFAGLTLPCLTSLTVRFGTKAEGRWHEQEFASFIVRSECALEKLELHDVPLESDSLQKMLQSLPSLSHLKIGYTYADPHRTSPKANDIVRLLTHSKSIAGGPFLSTLPSLTNLSLELRLDQSPITLALLNAMLVSRSIAAPTEERHACLEEVTLRFAASESLDECRLAIAWLKDNGQGWPRVYLWFDSLGEAAPDGSDASDDDDEEEEEEEEDYEVTWSDLDA